MFPVYGMFVSQFLYKMPWQLIRLEWGFAPPEFEWPEHLVIQFAQIKFHNEKGAVVRLLLKSDFIMRRVAVLGYCNFLITGLLLTSKDVYHVAFTSPLTLSKYLRHAFHLLSVPQLNFLYLYIYRDIRHMHTQRHQNINDWLFEVPQSPKKISRQYRMSD